MSSTGCSAALRGLVLRPAAAAALRPGRVGSVVLVAGAGGYVQLGEDFVLVGGPRAQAGPLSLILAGLRREHLRLGLRLVCEAGRLWLGELEVDLRSADRRSPAGSRPRCQRLPEALAAALASVPHAPAELRSGLAALAAGGLAPAVAALAGRGEGLTPAGDDVLAGFAAWQHAEGRAVALCELARGRSSPLALAYLRCAERGELPDTAALVRDAIRAGGVRVSGVRARSLASWGATSGFALLWGMAAAEASLATGHRC